MSLLPYKVVALKLNDSGGNNTLAGASTSVVSQAGAYAQLWTDHTALTPIANPFLTDANGEREFFIEEGLYQISVSGGQSWQVTIGGGLGHVTPEEFGAIGNGTDEYGPIQEAMATGKNVFLRPDKIYGSTLPLETVNEDQVVFSSSKTCKLIALDAMSVFLEAKTSRYQTYRNLSIDCNGAANYGTKLNFPKCVLEGVKIENALLANAWLAYFSCKIEQNCILINSFGDGVLVQDDVGVVNDIHIKDSVISGNAKNGINVNTGTTARTGFYLSDINMEQNATEDGYSHIKVGKVLSFFASRMYHENGDPNANPDNHFYSFGSGSNVVVLDWINMGDSASVPFDYFLRVGNDGNIAKNFEFSNFKFTGFGQKLIANNIAIAEKSSSILLHNMRDDVGDRASYASSFTGITITPNKTSFMAKRITTNQVISTNTTVIFNQALNSVVAATINARISPNSYDLATGIYTVREPGMYKVTATLSPVALASGIHLQAAVQVDLSDVDGPFYSENGDGVKNVSLDFEDIVECIDGQTISIRASSSNGSNVNLRLNSTIMTIEKVGTQFGVS